MGQGPVEQVYRGVVWREYHGARDEEGKRKLQRSCDARYYIPA